MVRASHAPLSDDTPAGGDSDGPPPPGVGAGGIDRVRSAAALLVSFAWVLWQSHIAATIPLAPVPMRALHLIFGFSVIFLMFPGAVAKRHPRAGLALDLLLVAAALVTFAHLWVNFQVPDFRRLVSPQPVDLGLAVTMLVVVTSALWRTTGLPLVITVWAFIAYAFLGHMIPGAVGHGGFTYERILSIMYLQLDGVLGSIVGASATLIFPVLVFGAMLVRLGGGDFFTDLAMSVFGRYRGAGGKVAVTASALFATVAGTGSANVATTGVFTIPLMKRTGYRPSQAAAIESAASIGGQVLPPVMGAAAFVMVEFLQVPYGDIVRHALLPAALFFFSVYVIVHLESVKSGIAALPAEDLRPRREVLKEGWHFLVPLLVLIYMIAIARGSVARAAFVSTVLLLVLDLGRRAISRQPLELSRVRDGVRETAQSATIVASAVAGIQVVIAVVGLTGLGIKLSSLLVTLAGGNLLVLLLLTMVASIILGTGLPTVPTYLVLAILTAPALAELGVPLVAAHFFVFYFGVWSDLTPPTALGPTIGAGIAGAPLGKTMLESMRLGAIGFVLPFMFVYRPSLLLLDPGWGTLEQVLYAAAGIFFVAVGLSGYWRRALSALHRGGLLLAGGMLITPGRTWSAIGLLVGGALLVWRSRMGRNESSKEDATPRPTSSAEGTNQYS